MVKLVEHIDDLRHLLDRERAEGPGPSGQASGLAGRGIPGLAGARPSERGNSVGFVPTMGAFHEGHRSLMRAARAGHDVVVVSLFVNPLQFGPAEDLDSYPHDPDGDAAVCDAEGVDLLFAPPAEEMYPNGPPLTSVAVAGLSEGLCGVGRPVHFGGVATVVTKLFSIVGPCTAYFGRKDFQQLVIVRKLVRDLSLPVGVVGCPMVREPDGLAMSSRNAVLTPRERAAATVLFRALRKGAGEAEGGERDPATLRRVVAHAVTAEQRVRLEYAEVVSADDLGPLERLEGDVLVAVAARVGKTRLIDNVTLRVEGESVTADLGVIAGVPSK